MKNPIRILLTLILTFATVSVLAQDDGGKKPRGPGGPGGGPGSENRGGPRPAPPIIAALDSDKDGEISAEEMANASEALATLDKDGDGKLSGKEIHGPGMRGRPGEESGPPKGKRKKKEEPDSSSANESN